jgi:dihydrofolate reductase
MQMRQVVVADMTMSIDGFTAGPGVDYLQPLGAGGDRLHEWIFAAAGADRTAVEELQASTGAYVMGRRTFDVGIDLWGDDGAFGTPCFVVTHRAREPLQKGPTRFTFVTEGVAAAIGRARAAAGSRAVCVMGGTDIVQQSLRAGLVDEMRVQLAPILLGAGTRLFDRLGDRPPVLERIRVTEGPIATHLRFRVVGQTSSESGRPIVV